MTELTEIEYDPNYNEHYETNYEEGQYEEGNEGQF